MKRVLLFFLAVFLVTNSVTFAHETNPWKGPKSVHICPVNDWDTYEIQLVTSMADYGFYATVHLAENKSSESIFVAWPTGSPIIVVCRPNGVDIYATLDSTTIIISEKLLF